MLNVGDAAAAGVEADRGALVVAVDAMSSSRCSWCGNLVSVVWHVAVKQQCFQILECVASFASREAAVLKPHGHCCACGNPGQGLQPLLCKWQLARH